MRNAIIVGATLAALLGVAALAQVQLAGGGGLTTTTGVQLQSSTPGTQQTGNSNISGTARANKFRVNAQGTAVGVALTATDSICLNDTTCSSYIKELGNRLEVVSGIAGADLILQAAGATGSPSITVGQSGGSTTAVSHRTKLGNASATTANLNLAVQAISGSPSSPAEGDIWATTNTAGGGVPEYSLRTYLNSTAYTVGGVGAARGAWTAFDLTGAAIVEDTNFAGGFRSTTEAPRFRAITCTIGTAGSGGTTGVVIRVRNMTDSSNLCSCTIGTCAATGSFSCDCNGTSVVAKNYTLQLTTGTDCAANPQNLVCNVEMTQ